MAENNGAPAKTGSIWKMVMRSLPPIAAGCALVVSVVAAFSTPATSIKQLTVVGSLVPAGDHWEISGRVFQGGDAIGKALVWAIVEYANGQHASPTSTQTDERGGFLVSPVPSRLGTGDDKIAVAMIYASKEIPGSWFQSKTTLRGEDKVRATGAAALDAAAIVGLSPLTLAPLVMIFLVSAMLPFFGEPTQKKYLAAIVLAFLFTGTMIFYISLGLRYVITEGKSKEILQLGFASIYRSTYVKDVPPEWVFSFTAAPPKPAETASSETKPPPEATPASLPPQATANPSPPTMARNPGTASPSPQPVSAPAPRGQSDTVVIDHGFGAPLWVLLVSVVGASVVTIALMVEEITKAGAISQMPLAQQAGEIRKEVQAMVRHQFFILFAPVTAIFVYQILLTGSAAASAFTVGLAALGAGPSLSALLTKAGAAAAKLFG